MELLIVHLTDIHIRDDEDFDVLSSRLGSIGGAICNHITEPDETKVLFCVTGDFVFSGKDAQYVTIGMILEEIYSLIKSRFPQVDICPVFVPGNHDCDFDAEEASLREALLVSPKLDITNVSLLKTCTSIQKGFFDFCDEWDKKYGAVYCSNDRVLTINEWNFEKENLCIKIHCINTSWCSKKQEEKGKMKIITGKMKMPSTDFPDKKKQDIVITMMHHDAEWLDWEDKEVWNNYHKKYSDIILVGHDHNIEFTWKENYDGSSNYHIKGNQLFDKYSPNQSGFNILKIKVNENPMQECFFTYEWDGVIYKKIIDTGYHPFVKNRFFGSGIELKEEIWEYLEELDIDINKDGRNLKLSDIFGFPTLREEKEKGARYFREKKRLIKYIDENKFIVLSGQREYGKTALLKQLFEEYYDQKKFPVFLNIAEINTSDGEILNKIIGKKYEETYNNITADMILQKDSKELVCLIDNFEEIHLMDKTAKGFLKYLTNKFGIVIISRNPKLDLLNPLSYVEMNDFIRENFKELVIQSVGKSFKDRIINQWLLLEDATQDINSTSFDAKKRKKYTQIQTVMKSNYFNNTPIDLLLVLSYLEQEQPAQINYSRFSYIYDGLIMGKLSNIANKDSNLISTYKTILQKLAYKMYDDNNQGFITESYLMGVVFDYLENHSNLKLKAADVVENLVKHRILECKDNTYKFKHRYVYYYFVGSYIDKKLPYNIKADVIKNVFANIDQDINYNIALFLAYNLNKEFEVLPLIKELEGTLLTDYKDFKYEDLKPLIEEWGGNIEKEIDRKYIIPENANIPILREKALEKQEELEQELEEKEPELKIPTDEDVIRLNEDAVKLGRIVSFMGDMLKNYAGEMENQPREETIDLMFRAELKIIGSFCEMFIYLVDKLISMVEEKIKDGTEEEIHAKSDFIEVIKYLFSQVWFQFISVNITVLANSLGSDVIKENINTYSNVMNTEFVKMTRLEYLLRIANTRLPVSEINDLFKGKECLADISQSILKYNISRYLSSYQFDDNDRRKVCTILEFNIKDILIEEQRLITLRSK